MFVLLQKLVRLFAQLLTFLPSVIQDFCWPFQFLEFSASISQKTILSFQWPNLGSSSACQEFFATKIYESLGFLLRWHKKKKKSIFHFEDLECVAHVKCFAHFAIALCAERMKQDLENDELSWGKCARESSSSLPRNRHLNSPLITIEKLFTFHFSQKLKENSWRAFRERKSSVAQDLIWFIGQWNESISLQTLPFFNSIDFATFSCDGYFIVNELKLSFTILVTLQLQLPPLQNFSRFISICGNCCKIIFLPFVLSRRSLMFFMAFSCKHTEPFVFLTILRA